MDFPVGATGKEPTCQYRRHRLDPCNRNIPWRGHENPLQYSCLGNLMDRGTWWAAVHRVAKSLT